MKTPSRRLQLECLEDRAVPTLFGVPWADPTRLTLSFVPDGTSLVGGGTSNLFATMNAVAPTSVWEGEILRAFQSWAVNAGINVGIVDDSGDPLGTNAAIEGDPRFGDIRIAALSFDSGGEVAAASPFSWSGTSSSGDVFFNTQYAYSIGNVANKYDLYSVAIHEAGHALGLDHSTVAGSVMNSTYSYHTGLAASDITNLQSIYGSRSAEPSMAHSNTSFATAQTLVISNNHAQAIGDLSTPSDSGYFKFTAPLLGLLSRINFRVNADTLSLVAPRLTLYNASKVQIGVVSTTDPLNNNVCFSVGNLLPGQTYYLKVTSTRSDVFAIGSYQVSADVYTLGLLPPPDPIVRFRIDVDAHTNDSIGTATTLTSKNAAADNRFDIAYQAQISDSSDLDFYKVTAPTAPAGQAINLDAIVWQLDPNALNPRLHLFDAAGKPIAFQVLANDAGIMTVQVANLAAGSTMFVEVSANDSSDTAHNTGSYFLGLNFNSQPLVTFDSVAAGKLGGATTQDAGTLAVAAGAMMELALSANFVNTATTANVTVTLTITDNLGNVVAVLTARAGQPTVTRVLYLAAGTYTMRYSASVAGGGTLPDVNYGLLANVLSDGVGPYQTSSSSGGSSSSDGSGYTYSGSNTSTTSGNQYWF